MSGPPPKPPKPAVVPPKPATVTAPAAAAAAAAAPVAPAAPVVKKQGPPPLTAKVPKTEGAKSTDTFVVQSRRLAHSRFRLRRSPRRMPSNQQQQPPSRQSP